MSRVFLMKWYHFTVEYFEDLRNINHCEFLMMRKEDNGKYLLENKLRTWSDLRREKAIKDKEKEEKNKDKDQFKLQRNKTFVVTRQWGGCPNGCNHSNHYQKRDDLELLRQKDVEHGGPAPYGFNLALSPGPTTPGTPGALTIADRRKVLQQTDGSVDEHKSGLATPDGEGSDAEDTISSSPDGTPSFISTDDRLRSLDSPALYLGRDGGGTYSGHTSVADSDTDISEDENRNTVTRSLNHSQVLNGHVNGTSDDKTDPCAYKDDQSRTGTHRRSNRLGDASPDSSEDGDPESHTKEDLEQAEIEDRSIRGSVY